MVTSTWIRLPVGVALLAWAGIAVADKAAGDYFVHSLPGAPEPLLKMHAGHIEVTPEHNGNLFFWHFQNKHIAKKQRTVIWLNGGPGCSSEDGALMEIGPYRLKDQNTLTYNEGAWNEFANVMFVDNPVGTGYSYVDTDSYVQDLNTMASQMVVFLEKWFKLFPEYEHDDLYFAGESYAGQHIPYIAKHILDRNKAPQTKTKWNLKGLIIGNGWIAPKEQYEAYLQYSYEKGIVAKDSDMANRLEDQHRQCERDLMSNKDSVDIGSCESILQSILSMTNKKQGNDQDCINMYDVRLRDTYPSCGMNWPPDLVNVTPYLRKKSVVEALHVNANKATGWRECDGNVGSQFRVGDSKPSIHLLPEILRETPILLFSGEEDLICNHLGTEALIHNMEWNNGKGFELTPGNWAPRREWTFDGEKAGFWQEARNLTYVLFHNSSHMVPFDYPKRSRDMLDRFMGVDSRAAGGPTYSSVLDGETANPAEPTTGGNTGDNTAASDAEKAKLDNAKWEAYRRSGEVVLVIVIIAAGAWGWYVWRDRRRRAGYSGLAGGSTDQLAGSSSRRAGGLEGFNRSKRNGRDVEAGDFDESELDDLHVATPTDGRYSVGGDSDDDSGTGGRKEAKGSGSGSR